MISFTFCWLNTQGIMREREMGGKQLELIRHDETEEAKERERGRERARVGEGAQEGAREGERGRGSTRKGEGKGLSVVASAKIVLN